jgi:hypothetical protein
MKEQAHAVEISHPPERLLRAVNPALKLLLRTPLAGPMRKQFMVLSFTGRKSGNQYSLPVSAHSVDNNLYALANAGWTKNFRGGRPAEVLHNGKTTKMNGELITDPAVVSDLSHRLANSYGAKQAQLMLGLGFRDPGIPALEEFKATVEREGVVAVKLTPA